MRIKIKRKNRREVRKENEAVRGRKERRKIKKK